MDEPRPFRFKVELEINNKLVVLVFHAEDLRDLYEQIHAKYPKNRIASIVGG